MQRGLIPFLLLVVPILEITVFILIGGQIGVLPTLGLILVTAIIGTFLLRSQGFNLLGRIQQKMSEGEMPGKDLVHGIMILVAGILLLTPGFVTDGIGFLLFFPPFRELLWQTVASRLVIHTPGNPFDNPHHPTEPDDGEDVINLDRGSYSEKPSESHNTSNSPWTRKDD